MKIHSISDIKTKLVDRGYKNAAFKYKRNAVAFMTMWKKKGYHVAWTRSSGPVVDADRHYPTAYYCEAEKTPPPKYTPAQNRMLRKIERLHNLALTNPGKYWREEILARPGVFNSIDPEIRDVIKDLNNHGIYTTTSCAGHNQRDRGIIFFVKRTFKPEMARKIMTKHGLTGITRDATLYVSSSGDKNIIYRFNPVGKYKRSV